MAMNTYGALELKAMDLIQESLDIQEPLNQEGMPGYYIEKIQYLKEARKVLESQIQVYEQQSASWSNAFYGPGLNNGMNIGMEGGKKQKKSRKTKKVKRR